MFPLPLHRACRGSRKFPFLFLQNWFLRGGSWDLQTDVTEQWRENSPLASRRDVWLFKQWMKSLEPHRTFSHPVGWRHIQGAYSRASGTGKQAGPFLSDACPLLVVCLHLRIQGDKNPSEELPMRARGQEGKIWLYLRLPWKQRRKIGETKIEI